MMVTILCGLCDGVEEESLSDDPELLAAAATQILREARFIRGLVREVYSSVGVSDPDEQLLAAIEHDILDGFRANPTSAGMYDACTRAMFRRGLHHNGNRWEWLA